MKNNQSMATILYKYHQIIAMYLSLEGSLYGIALFKWVKVIAIKCSTIFFLKFGNGFHEILLSIFDASTTFRLNFEPKG